MALRDLGRLEDLEFPEFSCLCELCDCGRHKHHQNCKKNQSIQRRSINADCLLTHYQSAFTQPLNIQPRSSKRPLRTPPYRNPPAMQCETTQRAEFGQRTLKERAKGSIGEPPCSKCVHTKAITLKERPPSSIHSGRSSASGSATNKGCPCKGWKPEPQVRYREPPATAGSQCTQCQNKIQQTTTQAEISDNACKRKEKAKAIPDNLKFEVMFQPLPFERKPMPSKKRPKAKSAPMETLTSYRNDFPEYKYQPRRMGKSVATTDNLRVNQNLPTDFNTTQKESYIGWDPTLYPRPDLIKFKDEMSATEGTIDSDTVTKLAFQQTPLTKQQQLTRPRTMQSPKGGKFDEGTAYKNFFKNWGTKARVRHGDRYEEAFAPPPGKINNLSITRQDFTPKCDFKPMKPDFQQKITAINREDSSPPPLPMCRLQAYLLHQQLKEMKLGSGTSPVATQ